MELCDLSAIEMARLLRAGQVSAVDLLDSALQRIEAVDGRPGTLEPGEITAEDRERVHSFITLTARRARAQAQAVDQALAAGEEPGPLAGVPVSVKDIFCVKDTPSTAASRILSNFVAPYTATPVVRMEKAGAVILGKTNLDEYTYGSSNEFFCFPALAAQSMESEVECRVVPRAAAPHPWQPARSRSPWAPTPPGRSASRRHSVGWWVSSPRTGGFHVMD